MQTIFLQGEQTRPWYKKINPIWWFGNDEASAQGNTFIYKYIRNPMQNFRWYVIGVVDRPHWVTGSPAIVNERSDMTPVETGWCFSVIWLGPFPLLPYISYSSKSLTFYLGWQPRGGLGAKLNFSNSAYG